MVNINKNKVKKFKDLINDNNHVTNRRKIDKNDKIINFDVFLKNNKKRKRNLNNNNNNCNDILNRLKEKELKEKELKDKHINNDDDKLIIEKEEEINRFIIEIMLQMGHVSPTKISLPRSNNNNNSNNSIITISKRYLNQKVVDSSINRIDESSSIKYIDKLLKQFEDEQLLTCKHGIIYLKSNFSSEMFNKLHNKRRDDRLKVE